MKENKKLETTNTEIVAQTPLIQITDNRREITELTDAEIKEIEKELDDAVDENTNLQAAETAVPIRGSIQSTSKSSNI